MPKLAPLTQWYCDSCGEVVQKPEHGYVVWSKSKTSEGYFLDHSHKIIHIKPHSPRNPRGTCDDDRERYPASLPLLEWIGAKGIIRILSVIDPGIYHQENYRGPRIRDMREWAEFLRRLHLPYYEEARRYWDRAMAEYFDDVNEVRMFMPDYLKDMIEHFEERDGQGV